MTSTNSRSKFIAAFKKLLKRRWAGAVIILLLSIIAGIIFATATVQEYNYNYDYDYINNAANAVQSYRVDDEFLKFGGFLCAIIGVYDLFACVRYFREIYKKRSCDYYFASPITRAEYFNSGFLFGFVTNAVSFCAGVFAFAAIIKTTTVPNTSFYFEKYVLVILAAMLLALLAAFAILLLCAVLAGKKLHYFVLAAIALISAPLACTGVATNINYIWGVIRQSIGLAALSPVGNAICAFESNYGYYGSVKPLFVISAVEIAAAYVIGLLVFKKRKAEVAEVSLTGKIVPFFFLALLQIYAFMRFGTIQNFAAVIGVGVVTAVVATLIYTAIFYKKAFTKETLITLVCTGVACVVFLTAVYLPSHSSFVKYVPQADEVESVELTNDSFTYSNVSMSVFNMLFYAYGGGTEEAYTVTSVDGIEKVIALHEKVVSDDVIVKSRSSVNNLLSDYEYYYGDMGFEIKYHLKDGRTVARQYSVNSSLISEEARALYQTEEIISQSEPFNVDLSKLAFAGVDVFDLTPQTDEYGDVYYDNYYDVTRAENVTDNYAELLDCLVADKANESAETFFATNNYFYYFDAADDYYYDYSEHNVGTIVLYVYSDMATKAYNDKIAAMSWEQFKAFANSDDFYEGDVHGDCLDTYSIEILDGDTRTIDYLKAHGIEIG